MVPSTGFATSIRKRGTAPCRASSQLVIIEQIPMGRSHSRQSPAACQTIGHRHRVPHLNRAFSPRAMASPPGRALRRVDRRVRDHSPVARRPMLRLDPATHKRSHQRRQPDAPEVASWEAAVLDAPRGGRRLHAERALAGQAASAQPPPCAR
jgi:hypothetical protein